MKPKAIQGVACAAVLVVAGLSLAAPAELQVGIHVFRFQPGQVEAGAGSRVTWTNQDDITHTVTSGTLEQRDGRFDQRLEGKGAVATVELPTPGVYPYFCSRHPSMRGEIRVH